MQPYTIGMEKIPTQLKETSPEAEANYEGNDSMLLIERLRNPVIKNQIIDMLYRIDAEFLEALQQDEWEHHLPEGWTGEEKFHLVKGKRSGRILDATELEQELHTPLPTRAEIEKALDEKIDRIERVTEMDFTPGEEPSVDRMTTDWELPWTGERPSTKQLSISEAHEKGHRIREYERLTKAFRPAFDLSKVNFTQRDFEMHPYASDRTLQDFRDEYLDKYLFSGPEAAERMSQLKNYFGMRGAEKFTKDHLHYAKEHYVQDTGMDNSMRLFFEAITPETEDAFIEMINAAGI